ncbi:hypothetical protein [Burkholderia anthina]|uniref:hypothetical protein n=1 Tax=Burkholderia anthina TaxID=179879 RepID=UPI001AA0638D|nr:hypothetical protein [Burkholderia anthina]QTD89442.1 hypothetical protein J4G50_16835 [Burkholderia anthina]
MTTVIVDPMSIESIDELRKCLHEANATLIRQFSRITVADSMGNQLAGSLNRILTLHIQENAQALVEYLDAYLADRPGMRDHLEEDIEGAALRKVH